jgi:hypothetical protein
VPQTGVEPATSLSLEQMRLPSILRHWGIGVKGRIRTDGFRVLQTLALGLSATFTLANLQGLEPRLTVLETDVLPLHQRLELALAAGIEPDCLTPYLPSTSLRRPAS